MSRDFTYITDVIDSIELLLSQSEIERDKSLSFSRPFSHQIYNVASGVPISLKDFLAEIERQLGRKAKVRYVDTYQGEMLSTFASTDKLHSITGYRRRTPLEQGVRDFLDWHKPYYK